MESLLALGLAANVVQFVDFTTKVVSETIKIYRSRHEDQEGTEASDLGHIAYSILRYTDGFEFDKDVQLYLDKASQATSEQHQIRKLRKTQTGERPKERSRSFKNTFKQAAHPQSFDPALLDVTKETQEEVDLTTVIHMSACDKEILRICLKCRRVAQSLQRDITRVQGARVTMWNSLVEALRTIWSREEVESLKQQLGSYRQQISLLLLTSFR